MKALRIFSLTLFISAIVAVRFVSPAEATHAQSNDFVDAWLRADLSEVYNARNYRAYIRATAIPATGNISNATVGWLGVFLGVYNGATYSGKFIQVGITTTRNEGIRWFVYAEPTVTLTCLRGMHPDPTHCYGNSYDIVSLNTTHRFFIEKSPSLSYWRIWVYDSSDQQAYEVARVYDSSNRIYDTVHVTAEEIYWEHTDPYITASFYFLNPQYMTAGIWKAWPASEQTKYSYLVTIPNTICPSQYGANFDSGIEWYWYAGSGGQKCSRLFPAKYVDDLQYPPLVYLGNWTHSFSWSRAFKNTVSWTNSNTSEGNVSYAFNGSSITRVFTMASNRGVTKVYMDGNFLEYESDYASTVRWQAMKTWQVSQGSHTIQLRRSTGGSLYSDLDAFIIDMPIPNIYALYDNRDPLINYLGSWENSVGWASAYQSTVSYSNNPEDAFTFTFYSNGTAVVAYVFTKAPNRGKAAVTIDGDPVDLIDLYSSNIEWLSVQPYTNFSPGFHTIHISVSGQKNGASSGYYVDVDAIFYTHD